MDPRQQVSSVLHVSEEVVLPVYLMTDIEGSTRKWEASPRAMERALRRHDRLLDELVRGHGGRVVKHTGDGMFAVFESGRPLACAMAIQRAMRSGDWGEASPLRLRIALHAGDSRMRDHDYFGPVVSRTARLLETAWGGQTVLTAAALEGCGIPPGVEIRDLGTHMLRDLSSPIRILGAFDSRLAEGDFPPLRTLSSRPNNLPEQTTPFVGREDETRRLKELVLLPDHRLVTVLGMGGMGKTRLAVQVASELLEDFSDGVFLVQLESVRDPSEVAGAIASSLGLRVGGGRSAKIELENYLRSREVLLVLDNFEHLLEAAPVASDMLASAGGLKLLATSRARLELSAETVFPLEGLEVPEDPEVDPKERDSVRLFLQSLKRRASGADMPDGGLEGVAAICRILGGNPLAIELASSWAGLLRPSEMLARLEKGIDLLAQGAGDLPARHRSMERVFMYSWELLDDDERELLGRLSVFDGTFSTEAALEVASATLSGLRSLQNKSLLSCPSPGRLGLHQLIAGLVRARTEESGLDLDGLREAHARYYLAHVLPRAGMKEGDGLGEAMHRTALDLANIRSAWDRAVDRAGAKLLADASTGLRRLFVSLGMFDSAHELLGRASAAVREGDPASAARIDVETGWLALRLTRYGEAVLLMDRAIPLFDEQDSRESLLQCLMMKFSALKRLGRLAEAREWAERSLELAEGVSDMILYARCLLSAGDLANHEQEFDSALELSARARRLFRRAGDAVGAANCSITLSNIHSRSGNGRGALREAREALSDVEGTGQRHEEGLSLLCLAEADLACGLTEEALEAAERAESIFDDMGDRWGLQMCWPILAQAMVEAGDNGEYREPLRKALELSREIGANYNTVEACLRVARIMSGAGDHGAAEKACEEAVSIAETVDEAPLRVRALNALSGIRLKAGDTPGAEAACRDALLLFEEHRDAALAAGTLEVFLHLAVETGRYSEAVLAGSFLLAKLEEELSDPADARRMLDRARTMLPGQAQGLERRAGEADTALMVRKALGGM